MPYTKKFGESLVKHENEISTKEEQLLNAPYGQQGAVIISEEEVMVEGDFYCIIALRDDVVLQADQTNVNWNVKHPAGSSANSDPWSQSGATQDIPMPVGMPFYGNFKSVELKSMQSIVQDYCGSCPKLIAYNR
tara:strand:+ start:38 stop:439 length:402 start_codon:yes stop_codon:yes gene_type:complete